DGSVPALPSGGSAGDEEFGRSAESRDGLRRRKERYVLDIPCNTSMRDLERQPPRRRKKGRGRKRKAPFQRVDTWAKSQPQSRWTRLTVRDAEKGPLEVKAIIVAATPTPHLRV